MQNTKHTVHFADARILSSIDDNTIDLVVTSPPYPMIVMWDELFSTLNPDIEKTIANGKGNIAFEQMHQELDKVWYELYRVVKTGGFVCINIGDATRTIHNHFRLYSNHSRITNTFLSAGFSALPPIIWRKQTNAPNKFMGSGMLPAGAYVTLEHEYILIFRKGAKRQFTSESHKKLRQSSALFWEERNVWFSDIWMDLKGTRQNLTDEKLRQRSAAYPFELAHRLINMYSVKEDSVLDPFLGTGTTMLAAMASERNSVGIELEDSFSSHLTQTVQNAIDPMNNQISQRLINHKTFVEKREQSHGQLKHHNTYYDFPVMTGQEVNLELNFIKDIETIGKTAYSVNYTSTS